MVVLFATPVPVTVCPGRMIPVTPVALRVVLEVDPVKRPTDCRETVTSCTNCLSSLERTRPCNSVLMLNFAGLTRFATGRWSYSPNPSLTLSRGSA
jgi:hypothetical protein